MTHLLTDPWTFYYILQDTENPLLDGLHKLGRIESVEQFWDLYRYIKRPSQAPEIEIGFFTKNFKLDRTDSIYKDGSLLQIPIEQDILDYQWERLLMFSLGCQLDKAVVGVSTRYDKGVFWIWVKENKFMDFVEDNVVQLLGIDDDDVQLMRFPIYTKPRKEK